MKNFGKRLVELREEKKISQQMLAKNINASVRAISRWETGVQHPSIENIIDLAQFFNVTVGQMVGTEDL